MPDKTPLAATAYLARIKQVGVLLPRLKRMRSNGMSHRMMGKAAGISPAAIGFILAGTCVPNHTTLAKLAKLVSPRTRVAKP